PAPDAPGRQPAGRDPPLDRPRRRPETGGCLAWAQLIDHVVSRLSQTGGQSAELLAALVRGPARLAFLAERPEPFLRLVGRALTGDHPGRVPLGRPVAEAPDLAHDRLRRAGRRRA